MFTFHLHDGHAPHGISAPLEKGIVWFEDIELAVLVLVLIGVLIVAILRMFGITVPL